ncbi:MAG: hypothetical protein MZV70_75680 [Desulfobacterales bacterium]|nr:hypothetical protein [Desulfobacterales bacterium]
MHEGLCYAEPYFQDRGLDPAGNDTDRYNGVDTATLFFSATHGTPETWLAMPNGRDPGKCPQSASETHVVEPGKMRLGNGQAPATGHQRRPAVLLAVRLERLRPRAAAMPGGAPDFGCPESSDRHAGHGARRGMSTSAGAACSHRGCGWPAASRRPPSATPTMPAGSGTSTTGHRTALQRRTPSSKGFAGSVRAPFPSASPWEVPASSGQPFSTRGFSRHPILPARLTYHAQYPVPFSSKSQPGRPAETGSLSGRPSSG